MFAYSAVLWCGLPENSLAGAQDDLPMSTKQNAMASVGSRPAPASLG